MSDSNITKKALAQALKGLMAEQPFSKISVGDICEECGMSRKSFYYHFKDKYDLTDYYFKQFFENTFGQIICGEDFDTALFRYLERGWKKD